MKIIVPGKPVVKRRANFWTCGPESEEGRFIKVIREQVPEKPEGYLVLNIGFFLPRPKNHYRTGRYAGQLKPWASELYRLPHKPMIDHGRLLHFVLKGLCKVGVYEANISSITACRRYADDGEPRTEIEILRADELI